MGLPEMPQRPGGETEALEESLAGDSSIVGLTSEPIRCTRCHRVLTADTSVRLERGPVCRLEVAA